MPRSGTMSSNRPPIRFDELLEPSIVVAAHPRQHRVVVEPLGGDAGHQLAVVRGGQPHVAHARKVRQTHAMLTSESRILTTHAGSLPRPAGPGRDAREAEPGRGGGPRRAARGHRGGDRRVDRQPGGGRRRHRQRRRAGPGELRHLRAAPDDRASAARASDRSCATSPSTPTSWSWPLPRFQRIKVSLMAAPAAIAEVTYRDTAELDAECALGGRRAVRADVHDGVLARDRGLGDAEPALRRRMEEYVRAVAAALRTEYQAIVDRGLLLQIDAPDLALERHTLFCGPAAVGVPRRGSSWSSTPSTAPSKASIPPSVRLHVCWGNYEGPHDHDVPFDDIQPLLYEANVGALVISMANARHAHEVRCFERRPAPRRHGPGGRGDRHDQQLRRAPRGGRRSHRASRARRSATRAASSPAPTAASTPPPASATSPRAWCGRSCARCGPAPTWRRSACSEIGSAGRGQPTALARSSSARLKAASASRQPRSISAMSRGVATPASARSRTATA